MDPIFEKNLISSKDAGELSGYSSDYLARLARSGKISGKRIGHSWFLDKDSLTRFLEQQGNRKIDYARALARAREAEYRARHSLVRNVAETLSKPVKAPFAHCVKNLLQSRAFAFFVAFAVVVSGAFITRVAAAPQLANQVFAIAQEAAVGFNTTFGNIPSNIASKINATSAHMSSTQPKVREASILALSHFPKLSVKFSLPRIAFAENQNAFRFQYRMPTSAPAALAHIPAVTLNVRDALTAVPQLISNLNLALGNSIIETTHAAIHADVATAYNFSAAAPTSARATLSFVVGTGDLFARASERATVQAPTTFAFALRNFNEAGSALAQTVFNTEYSGASRFVIFTNALSERYLAILSNTGHLAYADTLAIRDFGEWELSVINATESHLSAMALAVRHLNETAPAAIEDAYLGVLGKSALVLESVTRIPKVADALAAAAPAFSTGEKAALVTYQTINNLFGSATRMLATLFEPLPTYVLPGSLPKHTAATSSTPLPTHNTQLATTNSYPTYTTVVNGVSQDFVNESLASLRTNILATVSGMIQPVAAQTATNVQSIQYVNMIQDLSNLTVRNGSFLGGTFDGGSVTNATSVSAKNGSFDSLTAGSFSVADLSSTNSITAPSFIAASSTATSTFAGNISVSGNLNFNGTFLQNNTPFFGSQWTTSGSNISYSGGNVGIATTSPYALLSIGGNVVIGAATAGGTMGNLTLPALATPAGTFLAADANGQLIATTSPNASITADYPLTGLGTTGSHLSLAFGTTTANTWSATQTFSTLPVLGSLSGFIAGNSGDLYQVASSSIFGFTPASNAISINTSFPFSGGGDLTTSRTLSWIGLATTSQPSSSNLFVSNGTNGIYGVATTSATLGLGLSGALTTIGNSQSLTIATSSLYTGAANALSYFTDTNTLGAIAAGTGGFVLSMKDGAPAWVATSSINNGVTSITAGAGLFPSTITTSGTIYGLFATSSLPVAGNLTYWTAPGGVAGTPATFGTVGTTSISIAVAGTSGLTAGGTWGALVGGTAPTLTVATSSLYTGATGYFPYFSGTNTLTQNANLFSSGSNIGVGTTSPFAKLSVSNYDVTGTNLPLFIIASSTGTNATSTLLTVLANGNVGIGTTAPGAALEISGATQPSSSFVLRNTVASSFIQNQLSPVGNNTFMYAFGNAYGSAGGYYNQDSFLLENTGAGGIGISASNAAGYVRFFTGAANLANERMRITSGGNVGIGTTSPSQILSVQGNGLFSGNVSMANLTATGTASIGSLTGLIAGNSGNLYQVASSSIFGFTPASNAISILTSYPLTGGGDLTGNRTIGLAFGTTTTNTWSATQTFNGGATIANNVTLSGVTGTIQCLHVDQNGVISGMGSDCGTTSGGLTSVYADYPLAGLGTTGSHLTLAFGTSTSNTWGGTQTFSTAPIISTFSGLIGANNGTTYQVATSSATLGLGLSGALTTIGTSQSLTLATSSLYTGTIGQFSYFSGTNTLTGTSDIFDLSGNIGIGTTSPYALLSVGGNVVIGASTAGGTMGNLKLPALGTAAGTFLAADANGQIIATTSPLSSVTADYPLSGNGTSGSHLTLAFGTSTSNTWGGTQTFTTPIAETSGGTNQSSYALGDILYASGANTLTKLTGNSSTVQKFLSMTGSGSNAAAPSWQPISNGGTLSYYFYGLQSTSSPAYFQMSSTASSTQATLSYTNITSSGVLQNFITNSGFPGVSFIPAGQYLFHIHARQSGGTPPNANFGTLYAEIWEVNSTGADIAKIGTTEVTPTLTSGMLEYSLYYVNPNVYTMASASSRIVVRVLFTRTGGTDTVDLFVGGTEDSHLSLPSNSVDATNFVPYSGATKNLDLGLFNASTTQLTVSGNTWLGSLSGIVGANNGLLYQVASSSIFGFTPASNAISINTSFPFSGGGDLTTSRTLSWIGLATTSQPSSSNLFVSNGTNGMYGVATSTFSTSGFPANMPAAFGAMVGGSGTWTYWGLATTSQPASSNLLVSNGAAGVYGVATTSETCTYPLSCTAHTVLGGGGAITTNFGTTTTLGIGLNQVLYTDNTGIMRGVSTSTIGTFLGSQSAGVLGAASTGLLAMQATSTLFGVGTGGYVLSMQNGTAAWVATSSINNGVTSITAGAGLFPGTITTSGTIYGLFATSSLPVAGNLTYWTGAGGLAGTPATFGTVGTTTFSTSGFPANMPAAFGAMVGGSGTWTYWGLATTSQPASSNLLVSNGAAGVYGVATTSETCTYPLSCTAHTVLGGGGAITTNFGTTTTLGIGLNQVLYTDNTGIMRGVSTSTVGTFFGSQSAGVLGAASTGLLAMQATSTLFGVGTGGYVLSMQNGTAAWVATSSINNGVTSITAGAGLFPGTITTSGTIYGLFATSSLPVAGNLTYWTAPGGVAGTPATFGTVGTTTFSTSGFPANMPAAFGAMVGGSGTWTYWGLATTSQPASSNLLVSNGAAGVYGVATTSETCTYPLSCTAHTVLGGGGAITTNFGTTTTLGIGLNQVLYTDNTGIMRGVSTSTVGTFFGSQSAGVLGAASTGLLAMQATSTLFGVGTGGYVLSMQNGTAAWVATSSINNGVTSITAGAGLFPGTITTSGTIYGLFATSSLPVAGNLTYWTAPGGVAGTPATFGTVGTTSISIAVAGTSGLTAGGTWGALVGGTAPTLTVATSSLYTGATGYFPYFSGTNTLTQNANLFSSGSNIGVGTTSPFAKLSVAGSAGASTNLFAISTSTSGYATSTALTIDSNGKMSLLNGASLLISSLGTPAGTFLAADANGQLIATTTPISGVSSVSNSDSTLTISPTAGAVVASLNLANANTWTATVKSAPSSLLGFDISTAGPTAGYGIGGQLLAYASSTNQDTIFGLGAGGQYATTSATAAGNTAIGYQALNALSTGSFNTALGYQALLKASTATYDNAIGYLAMGAGVVTSTGSYNNAFGYAALTNVTSGSYNNAFGYDTLYNASTGTNNNAFGNSALGSGVLTGSYNNAIGYSALLKATSAGFNNAIGYYALGNGVTTGFNNTAIGYKSLYGLTGGYDNIMIGTEANPGGNEITTGHNNILLGYNSQIGTSTNSTNFLNIGNSFFGTMVATSTNTSLPTDYSQVAFGIGSSSPWAMLSINPTAGMTGPAFAIGSSTATNFVVTNAGNVGVGTTSPLSLLSIGTAGNAFRVDTTGAVKEGIWNGSTIDVGYGGTGQTSFTAGNLLYGGGSGAIQNVGTTTFSTSGFPANMPAAFGAMVGGSGTWTYWGLATTSQPASSNLLVSNGAAGVYGVATTSETCTYPLSCTAHTVLGGGGAITTNFGTTTTLGIGLNQVLYTDNTGIMRGVSTSTVGTFFGSQSAGVLGAASTGLLAMQATSTLFGVGTGGYVLSMQNGTAAWVATSSINNGVTSITAGAGLFPGTITTSGTIYGLFATSSLPVAGNLTYWTAPGGVAGTPATFGTVGTTSISIAVAGTSGLTAGGTWGALVGGTSPTLTVATSSLYTGATGYFPYFSGTNTLTQNPNLFSSGSNIGVGTTSPWAQLSINPNGITGPAFAIGSSTATKFVVTNAGNVGIGTNSPSYPLDVESDTSSYTIYGKNTSVGGGAGVYGLTTSTAGPESGIYGAATGPGNSAYAGYFANSGGSNLNWGVFATNNSTDYGIGVYGEETGTNNTGYAIKAVNNSATGYGIYSSGSSPNYFAGNVGIGTTTPSSKLNINGDVALENQGQIRLYPLNAATNYYASLSASSTMAANANWTLPQADGTAGQVLMTNGVGNLYFGSTAGAGTVTGVLGTWPIISNGNATTPTLSWGGLATTSQPASGNLFVSNGTNGMYGVATTTPTFSLGLTSSGSWSVLGSSPTLSIATTSLYSGTTGQIPYFSGTNTLTATSSIFLAASGIGIGTTTPLANLSIFATSSNATLGFSTSYTASTFVCGDPVSGLITGLDGLTYGTVLAEDGNCWLDRNLGAKQVATGYASGGTGYGDSYQWGRSYDGHQATTSPIVGTITIANNNDYLPAACTGSNSCTAVSTPYTSYFATSTGDWLPSQNDNLWGDASYTNNVCPSGFHVPTQAQWSTWATAAKEDYAGGLNTCTGSPTDCRQAAYDTKLKLPSAGYRDRTDDSLYNQGSSGDYWSGSPSGADAFNLSWGASGVYPASNSSRAYGFPIRCMKDANSTISPFGNFYNWTMGIANAVGSFKISQASALGTNDELVITSTGNTGIGTSTPQWLLNPYSATGPQLSLSAGAGVSQWTFRNAGGNLYFATTTTDGTATTTTSALTILNNGNVGIGTTTPQTTLHIGTASTTQMDNLANGLLVSGQAEFQDNTYMGQMQFPTDGGALTWADMTVDSSAALGTVESYTASINASSTLTLYAESQGNGYVSNTRVGVGTTTPYALLSIGGNVVIGASTAGGTLGNLTLPALGTAAGTFLAVNANGQVISTTTPTSGGLSSITAGAGLFPSTITTSGTLYGLFATSSIPTVGNLTYWTGAGGLAGTPATFGSVGTTSISIAVAGTSGLTAGGTWGALVGGTAPTLTVATSSLYTGTTGQFPYFSGTNAITSTSTLFLNAAGYMAIGTTSDSVNTTNPGMLTIDVASTSENAIDAIGNMNNFMQYNCTNFSKGVSAQCGYAATADTGTLTTGFMFMGINNSGYWNPTAYNVGGPLDTNILSDSNDLFIAQGISGKKIHILNGGTSTSTNEVMTFNGNSIGIGTTSPFAQLSINGASNGTTPLFAVASSTSSATTTVFEIDQNGNALLGFNGGYVGIGTTNPLYPLSVVGSAASGYVASFGGGGQTFGVYNSTGGYVQLGSISNSRFDFFTNGGAPQFSMNTNGSVSIGSYAGGTSGTANGLIISGNVGIGTTTPQWILNPYSSSAPQLSLSEGAGIAQWTFRNAGGNLYFATTTTDGTATTTTSALTILNNGNVGIGTTSPWGLLSINGNALASGVPQFVVGSSTATNLIVTNGGFVGIGTTSPLAQFSINPLASNGTAPSFTIGSSTATNLIVTNGGFVGIGTTSPLAQFSINPLASNGTAPAFVVGSSTATNFIVTNAGNVGIGTTTPQWILNPYSSSAPQLSLSEGAGIAQWAFRNANGNLYIATTTAVGTATSSLSALTITGSTGLIGIGTTSPWSTLSIAANANTAYPVFAVAGTNSKTNFIVLNNNNSGFGTTSPFGKLSVDSTNMDAGKPSFVVGSSTRTDLIITQAGYTGIGTTSPFAQFSIGGNVAIGASTAGGTMGTLTLGSATGIAAQCLRVDTNGLVSGTGLDCGSSSGSGTVLTGSLIGQIPYYAATGQTLTATSNIFIASNSNIGMGTTTPWGLLSVNGNALAAGVPQFVVGSSTATNFVVTNGGYVGVGTTTPGFLLSVGGSVLIGASTAGGTLGGLSIGTIATTSPGGLSVSGAVQFSGLTASTTVGMSLCWGGITGLIGWVSHSASPNKNCGSVSASSLRFKEDINSLTTDSGLPEVMALRSVSYKFTQQYLGIFANDPNMNGQQVGFVAEEVQKIDPRLITVDDQGRPDGVQYEHVVSVLAKAIQQLNSAYTLANPGSGATSTIATFYQGTTMPAMTVDATGNVGIGTLTSTDKLTVSGNVFANSYEMPQASVTSFTLGSTTVTAEMPSAVLTADGVNVDLYKLATYNLSGVQALAAAIDAQNIRLTSLETRVAALENGTISTASGSPVSLASSSLASAFAGLGAFLQNGIAQFGTLVADRFVAATNSTGASSAGTVTILAGNTVAEVTNSYALPTSKIFVTLTASSTGSWYISEKKNGSFKLTLSEPQTSDVSFDYFIVQTEGQIATSSPATSDQQASTGDSGGISPIQPIAPAPSAPSGSSGSTASSTPTSSDTTPLGVSDVEPPVVTLKGAAAIQINVGDSFADPGATATDETDGDLTTHIIVSGTVDTATAGLYTLTYTATDAAGNAGSVSRVVTVIAITAPADASPTTP